MCCSFLENSEFAIAASGRTGTARQAAGPQRASCRWAGVPMGTGTPEAIDGCEPLVCGPVDGGQLRAPVVGVAVRILLLLCRDARNNTGQMHTCVSWQMADKRLVACSPLNSKNHTGCCVATCLACPDGRRAGNVCVTTCKLCTVAQHTAH